MDAGASLWTLIVGAALTELSEVRPRVARLSGTVGAFLGLIGLGVIAGVLVTALTAPVIAVAGVGVTHSIGAFENSPSDIRPDALSQKSNIYATGSDGATVLLASTFDQDQQMVGWDDISVHAKDALVSTEDPRFYSHGGVDLQSGMRALLQNVRQAEVTSGASTISMQYVKNILVQRAENMPTAELRAAAYQEAVETSLSRKIQEMRLAMGIDK